MGFFFAIVLILFVRVPPFFCKGTFWDSNLISKGKKGRMDFFYQEQVFCTRAILTQVDQFSFVDMGHFTTGANKAFFLQTFLFRWHVPIQCHCILLFQDISFVLLRKVFLFSRIFLHPTRTK